jgi:hypothetical protein
MGNRARKPVLEEDAKPRALYEAPLYSRMVLIKADALVLGLLLRF